MGSLLKFAAPLCRSLPPLWKTAPGFVISADTASGFTRGDEIRRSLTSLRRHLMGIRALGLITDHPSYVTSD
jgi:hypothetical protein